MHTPSLVGVRMALEFQSTRDVLWRRENPMSEEGAVGRDISRRLFLKGVAATGMASHLRPALATPGETQSFRPNIVYIHSHDSGRYLQPYGYNVPTPHLQ